MHVFVDDGNGRKSVSSMSFAQTKQAIAIMDGIGRLIPQEGVDYDVEVIFKGAYSPQVSMNIVPLTDKGIWWKKYVMEMISKYPPTVDNPEQSLPEDPADKEYESEEKDAQVVP